ncbi:unnamed protein product [Adineta ricciae]|uniref:Uncharacterized protein n=1 Tax=Adineta ricciae TaxID=249248 RepID=A0A814RW04_ADIRI|nr:unnamed protein product [Adineta ricciae]CAF1139328.1 unnamed protein product [Adineta ricciae]
MIVKWYALLIISLIDLRPSESTFSIQQSLTILCTQFPLISNVNNSDLQCARLQKDEDVQISSADVDKPTELVLFILIDRLSTTSVPADIEINFSQSDDTPSSIQNIYFSLLITQSNFTINNQTNNAYLPYNILTFRWNTFNETDYELIDQFSVANQYTSQETSLCRWNGDQWNRLFYENQSTNISYVYFLKTYSSQLSFTLINASNKSLGLAAPTPFLDVLYCLRYRLGVLEIVLITCFGFAFLTAIVVLAVLHLFKREQVDRTHHFQRYHQTDELQRPTKDSIQKRRYRSNETMSYSEFDNQRDE